jgi:polyisoprenoid-binding protein YceI
MGAVPAGFWVPELLAVVVNQLLRSSLSASGQLANFFGRFNTITGAVDWDDDNPTAGQFSLRVDATTVDTANDRRDAHLRSPDFFNTNEFPQISFTSTKIERVGEGYRVTGDLSMHGVTKPITMNLKRTGTTSRRGNTIIGFEADGTVKRSDFNMNYGIEGGMLGDEVRLMIGLEAVRQ